MAKDYNFSQHVEADICRNYRQLRGMGFDHESSWREALRMVAQKGWQLRYLERQIRRGRNLLGGNSEDQLLRLRETSERLRAEPHNPQKQP